MQPPDRQSDTHTHSHITHTLSTAARRAFLIRTPTPPKTIWPGEFLEIQLPDDAQPDAEYAVEPRTDTSSVRRVKPSQIWPQPCDRASSVIRI